MKQTALQILLNDIENTLSDKNNPFLNSERILMLNVILLFIKDENLLEIERQQIIEAAKNFANTAGEAEDYYAVTYGE